MTDALPVDVLPSGLTPATVLLVVLAALTAGFVDAVVGGGGLVQLPALLLVPGLSPVQALATNKLGSILGTTTSAVTYHRRVHPDLRTALPMAVVALATSFLGASIAALLPAEVFEPVIASMPSEMWTKRQAAQVFHELLDHRWYLSEQERRPVSFDEAIDSYVRTVLPTIPDERAILVDQRPPADD